MELNELLVKPYVTVANSKLRNGAVGNSLKLELVKTFS